MIDVRKYEFIVNASGDSMTLIGRDGYEAANESFCRAHDKTREEIVGHTVADVWGRERYATQIKEHLDRCFAGDEVRYQAWFEFASLGLRCFDVAYYPYRDDEGAVTHVAVVSRDVTERRRAEEALRESEAKYRALVEQIPAAIYTAAPDEISTTLYFSPQVEKMLGFSQAEWTDDPTLFYAQLHPDDRERVLGELARSRAGGEPFISEYRLLARDGSVVWFRDEAAVVRDEAGNPLFLQGVMLDITGRRQAERVLARRMKQLSALSRASQAVTASLEMDLVLGEIISLAGEVTDADYTSVALVDEEGNPVRDAEALPGVPGMEDRVRAEGHTAWVVRSRRAVVVDDVDGDGAIISQTPGDAPGTLNPHLLEIGVRSLAGLPLVAKGRLLGALFLASSRPHHFHGQLPLLNAFASQAAIAIQNARLLEQARAGREQMQALSRRLVEAQEVERARISRELHDEAGQGLASLMVTLGRLEQEAGGSEAVAALVRQLQGAIQGVWDDLHRLAVDLRPPSLDKLGLVTALRQYAESFGDRQDLAVQFDVVSPDGDVRLPPEVETALYRIVQETLTNAARHARATRIGVLLEQQGGRVTVTIEDDGVGFDAGAAQDGHRRLGLLGARERAEMLGGALAVESAPGTGTVVSVEIPYYGDHPGSR